MTNEHIQEKLAAKFGENVSSFTNEFGMMSFEVKRDLNTETLQFLRTDQARCRLLVFVRGGEAGAEAVELLAQQPCVQRGDSVNGVAAKH